MTSILKLVLVIKTEDCCILQIVVDGMESW